MTQGDEVCPKCGYERQAEDRGPTGECARCGVIFAKLRPVAVEHEAPEEYPEEFWPTPTQMAAPDDTDEPDDPLWRQIARLPVTVKPRINTLEFGFHAGLFAIIFLYGCRLLWMDFRSNAIASTFMHSINLVFHEAGHLLFSPFGDFMRVAGGSLNQLLIPLVVLLALMIRNRDNLGASVGLWWLGTSFKDLAPYINDARSLSLPLLGGVTGADVPGYHDWQNLLSRTGLLTYDYIFAQWSDRAGTLCILVAFVWGGYILVREYQNRDPDYYEYE